MSTLFTAIVASTKVVPEFSTPAISVVVPAVFTRTSELACNPVSVRTESGDTVPLVSVLVPLNVAPLESVITPVVVISSEKSLAEFGKLVVQIAENDYLNGEVIRLDGAIRMQAR